MKLRTDLAWSRAIRLSRRRLLTGLGLLGMGALAGAFAAPLRRDQFSAPLRAELALASDSPDVAAWHGKTKAQHLSLSDRAQSQGYRFVSLSIYGSTASPLYAAVLIKPPADVTQHDYPALTAQEFQRTFDDEAANGYGPIILAAAGSASSPLFTAVFEPQNPIPLTRYGLTLTANGVDPANTIQGVNADAKDQGLILRWAASYGDRSNPAFAGIWVPNTGSAMWNNDSWTYQVDKETIQAGLLDSASTYQARFDAEAAAWARPQFVTLNRDGQYFSLFVDSHLTDAWVARHAMTATEYEAEYETWTGKGYVPVCVQAAGPNERSARFAAIFVRSHDTVTKTFRANGPVANAGIDAVVQERMRQFAVRQAALAIVHGTRLVYARGYTLAEPDWPEAQPTTCFRLASVSKTPTAIAIYQLIEAGTLQLDARVNDILDLRTPSGGPPTDPRFKAITIRQLLEHTSGVDPSGVDDALGVRDAFAKANRPHTLPVTAEMTDAYIASLQLTSDPGATQDYNNCGYYLLGRVVGKLRGTSRPIDAYQQFLFDPLQITRIHRGASLLADQPTDEARYQDYDLLVAQSQMSGDAPLVPDGYGNFQLEINEGGGGLSGAVADVALLIAIFLARNDTPALKRSTVVSMLKAGAQLQAAHPDWRSGYGLDGASERDDGLFYGQKGGVLDDASSVLQFEGDWGYTMLWGSGRPGQLPDQPWYPDFPGVMNIAKRASWRDEDLFPIFGMASL